jgi:hypothetical protein
MVDNLSDRVGRYMQAKQGTGLGSSKSLAASTTVKQVATFILTVFATNGNVALTAQTVIFALLVGAETLFKIAH